MPKLKKYQKVKTYLAQEIATAPNQKVFADDFSFEDIYVSLKTQPIDANGHLQDVDPVELETWVKEKLQQEHFSDQVILIQGEAGAGKSVFCRFLADWVRESMYPQWTPILINLNDFKIVDTSFEYNLRSHLKNTFLKYTEHWFNSGVTRFLFLLDGFDELPPAKNSRSLEEFLQQVAEFQKSCSQDPNMGHQVIITGRSVALTGLERFLPSNLERVELLPMDDPLQQEWFGKWANLFPDENPVLLSEILEDPNCPESLLSLAKEPLWLYFLSAMYRDGQFNPERLFNTNYTQAKILIYQQVLEWVVSCFHPTTPKDEFPNIDELDNWRSLLIEIGLSVRQSGSLSAPLSTIGQRFEEQSEEKTLLAEISQKLERKILKNPLATFANQAKTYLDLKNVEISHKTFTDFLFATRLSKTLNNWTQPGINRQQFYIPNQQMDWEIYDLLGYGRLTIEIVEFVMGLLQLSPDFRPVELFQRLEHFYDRWCQGVFIDAIEESLPQKKARQLHKQGIDLGQRQVDLYAGMNAMILLLELHRYGQSTYDLQEPMNFYPCGHPDREQFDKDRLFCIMGYSCSLDVSAFLRTVGLFLSGINLSKVDLISTYLVGANFSYANLSQTSLSMAYLSGANLSSADLSGAYLTGANLSGANLSYSNLTGANLHSTDLFRADLHNADLTRVNLRSADLSGANLSGVNLMGANLSDADLQNITWDENTNWEAVQGLDLAVNVPEPLQKYQSFSSLNSRN
jgi:hypothetical protein